MMNVEYLEDYDAREKEQMNNFFKKLYEGEYNEEDRYPAADRLCLKTPYTKSILFEKIWYQIPLYGTTVIELAPLTKDETILFERAHGFSINDIDKLIDFAKESGKIQFCLCTRPTEYKESDFLESIFQELKPPVLGNYRHVFQILFDDDSKKMKLWRDESYFLIDLIDIFYHSQGKKSFLFDKDLIVDFISGWMALRSFGYHEIAEEIADQFIVDPIKAYALFNDTINLLIEPYLDPLKYIKSLKISERQRMEIVKPLNQQLFTNVEFPCEVGKFLNSKLKLLIPENINGAIELNEEYNLYDLRDVMGALNRALKQDKVDEIYEKTEEISIIFENVWSDAEKLKRKIKIAKYAISLGIGGIGAIATMPIGGIGGLLAGLGFQVADKIADIRTYDTINEKIMKWTAPNHLIHIYDFRKKYKVW